MVISQKLQRILVALLLVYVGFAQRSRESARVTLTVLDHERRPLNKAFIDHAGELRWKLATDHRGMVEFTTASPSIVIRKAGYRSKRLELPLSGSPTIELESLAPNEEWLSGCVKDPSARVKTAPTHDIDYQGKNLRIKSKSGEGVIVCGRGPSWSWGIPSDRDVWNAVAFAEIMLGSDDGVGVVDTRGKAQDGTHWRYRGVLGESCHYSGVTEQVSKMLDCYLDKELGRPSAINRPK